MCLVQSGYVHAKRVEDSCLMDDKEAGNGGKEDCLRNIERCKTLS